MEKQLEYDIRMELCTRINNRIQVELDNYYNQYKSNIGYLIYYPLIYLERQFQIFKLEPILANDHRYVISWFLKEMMRRGIVSNKYEFRLEEFERFGDLYKSIYGLYHDHKNSSTLEKMRSVEKVKIEERTEKEYKLLKPTISDPYFKGLIYYLGTHDEDKTEEEHRIIKNYVLYLHNEYPIINLSGMYPKLDKKIIRKLEYLDILIDNEFLKRSYDRVMIDIEKISTSELQSDVIADIDEVKRIYGYFNYISNIHLYLASSLAEINKENYSKYIIQFDKVWLINKISKIVGINYERVKSYIEYLTLSCHFEGLLSEFPIVDIGNYIVFIPSNFILNDLQFSIVNGHYYKNINFVKRDDTVSKSVVDKICERVKGLNNISCVTNKMYNDHNLRINSDIDVAILDNINNKLLIIECKWKENVFVGSDNYIEIENSINKIYRKQLDKHKLFLENNYDNIKYIFENELSANLKGQPIEILYVIVDKRVQYHYEDKHILSEFMILQLLQDNICDSNLDLTSIFEEIRNMRTEVSYNAQQTDKIIELNKNVKIYHNLFLSEY